MDETIARISQAIEEKRQIHHTVINAGKVVAMQEDPVLRSSVVSSDLINADGMAVVWAIRFLGHKIPERVTGIDLMFRLIRLAQQNGYKCFFLGAKEDVIERVVARVSHDYSPSVIAGYRNGYFSGQDEPFIATQIAESRARILFVAITSPKKENFLAKHKSVLGNVNFIMGVGGSFDVLAGVTRRAPVWMQSLGFEWLYRLMQEPGRMWKRYLIGNSRFILLVLKARLGMIPKNEEN